MAQCSQYSSMTCIGTRGNCDHYASGCLHAKKDREDEERDRKAAQGGKSTGKIGFWGWAVIVIIAIYIIGKK